MADDDRFASRRRVLAGGGAAIAAGLLPRAPALAQASGGVTKLRYAHSAPTSHVWQIWGVSFKETVEKSSGGKIQVTIFPNAQMGDEQATASQVRLGSLEMGAAGTGLMNWVPQMSVTDGPFLFESRNQCYNALDGALGDALKKIAGDKGFRIVGWHDIGSRCITNSRRPIVTADDMKGLKMRVPPAKSYIAMIQAMGASTVSIDLSELYLALSQHLADGQDTPPSVVKSLNLAEVQKYVSKTDHVMTCSSAIMNPAAFEKLPADQKQMVTDASVAATKAVRDFTLKDEAAAYAYLATKGMQVTDKVDGASFRKACANVIPSLPDLFPPDLVKLARSAKA